MQEFEVDLSVLVDLLEHACEWLSRWLVRLHIKHRLPPPVQPCLADRPFSRNFSWSENLEEECIEGVVVGLNLSWEVSSDAERIVVKFPIQKKLIQDWMNTTTYSTYLTLALQWLVAFFRSKILEALARGDYWSVDCLFDDVYALLAVDIDINWVCCILNKQPALSLLLLTGVCNLANLRERTTAINLIN